MTVVETARLSLREAVVSDSDFLCRLMTEEAFLRFVGDRGVHTPEEARTYIRTAYRASYAAHGFGLWIAERLADGDPVGICGLLRRRGLPDVEIGFAFLPEFRGQGFGFESAAAVLEYGRATLGLQRIIAITNPENVASIRLLEQLGMTREGTVQPDGERPELLLYA